MDMDELRERYEDDARLLNSYGFLLESHARNELRQAVALYERAIEVDPDWDKPHYQLISARAGLREHRFLAHAYLAANSYAKALEIAEAGLVLAPGDAALTAARGEAKAGLGEVEGALADWRRALELDPEDIGALYSSAFLLERQGRHRESAAAWQAIIDWNDARGLSLESEWPNRELERLRQLLR